MLTNSNNGSRQLILAIDACEWNLVRKWTSDGKLPTFKKLLDQGTSGMLATTAPQLPDTVWSCIYGGRNPATFEKYFYVQYNPATGDLRHVRDEEFTKRPFWDILSDAGRKVGVVDIVKFASNPNLNGFQLTNWGVHASTVPTSSTPADLLPRIISRFGKHPVGDCDKADHDPRSQLDLRRRILEGVRMRGEVVRWLMQEEEWDVFVAGFSETHCVGHHFWHWQDESSPHYEPDSHGLADTMEQVYRAIDSEIGKMLELLDENATVIVVSGHGMGPLYHASWNLPQILDLLGFGRGPAHKAGPADNARRNPWRVLKMVLPGRLQYFIRNLLPKRLRDELLFRWYAGSRDWRGHRAFAVPNNDSVAAIRINLEGRDRYGIVPASEYDALCDEIATAMYELEDPVTGRKVVEQVSLSRAEFGGEFLDALPDLTVAWEQSFPWSAVRSPRFGSIALANQDLRSGSHSNHGFFIADGPGVPAGIEVHYRSIYDVAPTILQAANVPVPDEMEGRSLLPSGALRSGSQSAAL